MSDTTTLIAALENAPGVIMRSIKTSCAHLADQRWNPSPRPNVVDETRALAAGAAALLISDCLAA